MEQENDIQSIRRLLNEIAEMCDHATLTGSLSGGARRTAQRYNALLNRLIEHGNVPSGLFTPIPEDSTFAEIGVESRMLASYFPGKRDKNREGGENDRNILLRLAPFLRQEELGLLVREQIQKGSVLDMNMLSSIAPFLGQDILGEMVRAHLKKEESEKESTTVAAQPVATAVPAVVDYRPEPVAKAPQSVSDLLDLLKSPYLSDEERNELVEKLRGATYR